MKKVKIVLVMAIAMLGVTSAKAQVSFGVKGGLNISEMSLDEDVFNTSNRMGFFAGPILRVSLPIPTLGFDVAALYDQRETKINDETVKQQSIVIPANLRLNLGLSDVAGIYVAAGPQIGFNIGDDEYSLKDLKGSRENAQNNFQLKKSVFSVNVGGGVNFGHFEVGVTYNIGISNTAEVKDFNSVADKVYDNRKAKSNSWQLSGVIYF
ncbi:MAG: PorT family protein [Prevotella sp.]|nr:PorT family protein [Prevotella sp.]